MGGKAFKDLLPKGKFPRMSPEVYLEVKSRIHEQLKKLYSLVGTPAEAPEKPDYGDVDFMVCGAHGAVNCGDIENLIGAVAAIPMEGNRTSNYSIPSKESEAFYQIDIHVCEDENEWGRIMFYNSYGDLGMILSLLSSVCGLSLGRNGLKIPLTANALHIQPFLLSADFTMILHFMSLSYDKWKAGFSTQLQIFEWVSSSRFFEPERILKMNSRKGAEVRAMYQAFLHYVSDLKGLKYTAPSVDVAIEEAKDFFGKRGEYEALVRVIVVRNAIKTKFSGTQVIGWTGLYGVSIRRIMDGVRARLTDDEIADASVDLLKSTTLEVQKELGLCNVSSG